MNDIQVNYQADNNEVAVKKMSFLQRLVGVLLSPGTVMENLAERPRVLFGILASLLAMPLFYLLRLPLYINYLRDTAIKAIPFNKERLGVETTPEMIEQQLPFSAVIGIIGVAFMGIVMLLIITLIFFAIFKIMGGQGKFKAYLSVTGYAYVITILYFIVTAIASFFTGSLHDTTPLTSLANLLPQDMKGQFLYGMANGVDIFGIWYYAVIAIGMAKVSKINKTYVYGAVCIVFIIGLLIGGFGAKAASAFM